MADRPIIFSAPMIRALLDGRKSQTRRLVKRGPVREWLDAGFTLDFINDPGNAAALPYQPGDQLWVRETWCRFGVGTPAEQILYRATEAEDVASRLIWRPSIHMPRWASRLTLTVTAVRVERLQAITEGDAMAEGAEPVLVPPDGGGAPHVEGFRDLWNHLHGPGAWDANPEVVAITFTVRKGNIDHAE